MINTVLGPIDTSELGKTLTHEHLFVGPAGSYKEFPELLDEERLRLNPHGYLYIQKTIFPMLIEMGADEKDLNHLFINGPRNYFEGKGA